MKPPPEGSRIFQSYWSMPGSENPLELDHPIEMLDVLEQSNEFWQWRMPVPRESNGRVTMGITHMDVGLVHRDENGRRKLLAGGVVYYPYDPWTGRIDTS